MTLDTLKDIARFNAIYAKSAFEVRGTKELDMHRALYDISKCIIEIVHALREYDDDSTVDSGVKNALTSCIVLQAKLVEELYSK